MNNNELLQNFIEIGQMDNPLDQIIALKKFRKQYKKSNFYKQTHLNIIQAFRLSKEFNMSSGINNALNLLTGDKLAEFLNEQFYSLQVDVLLNKVLYLVDYEQLSRMLQSFMPDIDTEEIKNLLQQFKEAAANLIK